VELWSLERVLAPYHFQLFSANIYSTSLGWLEKQKSQPYLYAIYIGRDQNNIYNIALVNVGTWVQLSKSLPSNGFVVNTL
jgi:hypothetical protein